jgi:hypothetical protein
MGALKSALTGRLMAAVAVCFAIAVALFMCGGVGNVAADEAVLEVPVILATETNDTSGVYYGLTVVQWIVAAAGLLTLVAFLLMKDFRILLITAALIIVVVVMEYL